MSQSLTELTQAVDRLTDEATDLRTQLRARTRALWSAVIAGGIVLACTVCAAFVVSLNNADAIRTNNQKLCPMVTLMVPRPGDPPALGSGGGTPTRGQVFSQRATELAEAFGCPIP